MHVVMIGSMSNVFCEHQLLHCKTIEHCLMLDEDVCKGRGGVSHMQTKPDKGRESKIR